jgi:hypothetical protein
MTDDEIIGYTLLRRGPLRVRTTDEHGSPKSLPPKG